MLSAEFAHSVLSVENIDLHKSLHLYLPSLLFEMSL